MKKSIILYALSTAINKGAVLLFFPLLTVLLTLEEFGKWSLVMSVASLLIPTIALNGSSSILREGSANIKVGFRLLHYFTLLSFSIGVILYTISIFIIKIDWVSSAVLIGSAESIIFLSLTYIRTQDKAWAYLSFSLLKAMLLLLLIIYAKENNLSLTILLEYQFYLTALFATVVTAVNYKDFVTLQINFKNMLLFSIMLIPHSISQWIMSSSDRLILGFMENMTSVGIYSLAYNIALVLMLINSGIAMAVPTFLIKDYLGWKDQDNDNKIIKSYTVVAITLYMILIGLYVIDHHYFSILGYYGSEMLPIIGIIYLSIYILGLYYFFANYLFYHKKAGIISKTTFIASVLNILFTVLLVKVLGPLGAAIGTLLAYSYYLYSIRAESLKHEPYLYTVKVLKPLISFCISITLITIGLSSTI